MRFKKGSKVEVLRKEELSGSWWSAEIVLGNGHYYMVRYDCPSGVVNDAIVERVSRRSIRPCPPVVGVKNWVARDVVEVFDDVSWRIVVVLEVLGGDYYLVRLLGSLRELKVHKSNIRVRQLWQDDKWIVIGKGYRTCEDVKLKMSSALNAYQKSTQVPSAHMKMKVQAVNDLFTVQKKIGPQESHVVSRKTLKRAASDCSSHIDMYAGNIQKMRVIEKEGRCHRVTQSPLLEKVHAVAYPRDNLGGKYMHASLNNQTTEYDEIERGERNVIAECAGSSEPTDFGSDICSVGSCSGTYELPSRMFPGISQDSDSPCSDAESFYEWRTEEEKCPLPPEEELAASVHRLELHAYCSTLEAFYASGPLSWEQEALLTNLRISLHISNDEHLMELKTLVSAGKSSFC